MAISFGKEDCQQQVINYSCILQGFFFTVFMHDLRGKARREEATWPGGGACCCCWSVVRMVVHGGAAGDPLQLLDKEEKQRWMLVASVAFGWGRGEVTMCVGC
jgi:hypothetical protein